MVRRPSLSVENILKKCSQLKKKKPSIPLSSEHLGKTPLGIEGRWTTGIPHFFFEPLSAYEMNIKIGTLLARISFQDPWILYSQPLVLRCQMGTCVECGMGSVLSCGCQGKRTNGHWRGEVGVETEIWGGLHLMSRPVLSAFHRFFSLCNWCWVSIIDLYRKLRHKKANYS